MDLETFKKNCCNAENESEIKDNEFDQLLKKQHKYGEMYEPIYKLLKGHFCPNCNNKLLKTRLPASNGFVRKKYRCLQCEYEFLTEEREGDRC